MGVSALAIMLASVPVHAQQKPIYQDGPVITNHLGKFVTQSLMSDVGGLEGDVNGWGVAPFGITDRSNLGLCVNSGNTKGAYNALCLGHDSENNGVITLNSYGGMAAKTLKFRINGITYSLPGDLSSGGSGSTFAENDVRQFGAKCDGTTDDTAAVNAAIATGSAFIPEGTCLVSTLAPPPAGASIQGASRNSSYIRTSSATADVLPITNGFFWIDNVSFDTAVTRTAGCYIRIQSSGVYITNFVMNYAWCAIKADDGLSVIHIDQGMVSESRGEGQNVIQFGHGTGTGSVALYFGHTVLNSSTPDHRVITLTNVGDIVLDNLQVLSGTIGLLMQPNTGQVVVSVKCTASWFDQGGNTMYINPVNTGFVGRVQFDSCWFGSGTSNGAILQATGSASIDGVTFTNSEAVLNGESGLAIDGNVRNVSWIGGVIAGNEYGIWDNRASGYDGLIVQGAFVGSASGLGPNNIGIDRVGLGDYFTAIGNNVCGNTTAAYQSAGHGTNSRVRDNACLNTTINTIPVVGASPYTYRASDRPEIVYVWGGEISSINVNGTVLFDSAATPHVIPLAPNDYIVVTYTVAPELNVQKH
jgi:hypothetical protein